jgi:undecaprenyl-diphosphatase
METLKYWDSLLLKFINGLRHPFLDELMWLISDKLIWFPLYALLIYLVYRQLQDRRMFSLFLAIGLLTVGAADFTATYGFKKQIKRYRPSHHLELSQELQFHTFSDGKQYRGGQYGFVSGHATNSFVIAVFFGLFFYRNGRKIALPLLLFWAFLVSYSRMYLGVHYPSDIIGGTLLGMSFAAVGIYVFRQTSLKLFAPKQSE